LPLRTSNIVTRLLILLNVLGFVWELRAGGAGVLSGNIPENSRIWDGTLMPVQVLVGHQYYRIFTSAFLHGSIIHIGVNMLSLYWLGRFIEMALRPMRTLFVYFVSLVVAGFCVVYFSPPNAATLGASGAIFGLFGALFAIGLKLGDRGRDLVRSNIGILILNLVWSFSFPGISWQAHVGGLIAGFITTYVIWAPPRPVMTRVYDQGTGAEYESHVEMPDDRD
jgi:membrane associated rhomboid family serine protease